MLPERATRPSTWIEELAELEALDALTHQADLVERLELEDRLNDYAPPPRGWPGPAPAWIALI